MLSKRNLRKLMLGKSLSDEGRDMQGNTPFSLKKKNDEPGTNQLVLAKV